MLIRKLHLQFVVTREKQWSFLSPGKTQLLHLLSVSGNQGVCSFNQKRFIIAAEFFKVIYL